MVKLREARSERDRPNHHDSDSTIPGKVTKKNPGKIRQFARFNVLFGCVFQLYLRLVSELLLSSKSRSEELVEMTRCSIFNHYAY